jgi:hypothetical protein
MDLLEEHLDNNQPEVGCKCGQVLALLKEPRHPVAVVRKPNGKMAFLKVDTSYRCITHGGIEFCLDYHIKCEC